MYESPIMMYSSPVEEGIQKIISEENRKQEKLIREKCYKIGVDVNKEELLKALAYDRHQYQTGYADSINDVILQLEAEIESSDKYIREYEDTKEQRCFNQGLRAALKVVKRIGR